jgi:hypothetical protein
MPRSASLKNYFELLPRDLPGAIRQAQASGLPAVVDVIVDREPSPDDWRTGFRTAGET